jgi:nucleoside-diphosphate-sugar epimerase
LKVLVTGSTGFIGKHLLQALLDEGYDARVLARSTSTPPAYPHCDVITGDLTEPTVAQTAVQDVDAVYHLAAIRDRWGVPYEDYYAINVEGTRALLDAAVENDAQFIYCSSVGVLGYPSMLGIDEGFPYRPEDGKYNYHQTKVLAEKLVQDYVRLGKLPAVIVRPVITYGPGDEYGMVTKLMKMVSSGRYLQIGNGRNHVHLAYVSDTVRGIIQAGTFSQMNGQAYILPGTRPITMNELLSHVCTILGREVPRWHVPLAPARYAAWMFESLFTLQRRLGLNVLGEGPFLTRDKIDTLTINRGFNGSRAASDLDYCPRVDYVEGLARATEWGRRAGLLS